MHQRQDDTCRTRTPYLEQLLADIHVERAVQVVWQRLKCSQAACHALFPLAAKLMAHRSTLPRHTPAFLHEPHHGRRTPGEAEARKHHTGGQVEQRHEGAARGGHAAGKAVCVRELPDEGPGTPGHQDTRGCDERQVWNVTEQQQKLVVVYTEYGARSTEHGAHHATHHGESPYSDLRWGGGGGGGSGHADADSPA